MPACANERRIGAVRQLNAGCKLADTPRRAAAGQYQPCGVHGSNGDCGHSTSALPSHTLERLTARLGNIGVLCQHDQPMPVDPFENMGQYSGPVGASCPVSEV